MPVVACPACKSIVRFEGVAGICPKCAAIIRAQPAAPTPKAGPKPTSASNDPRTPRRSKSTGDSKKQADLSDLESDAPEVFEPSGGYEAGAGGSGGEGMDPLVKKLAIGAGAILFVFGAYVVLSSFFSHRNSTAIIPPPPAPLHQTDPDPVLETAAPVVPPPVAVLPTTAPAPLLTAASRPAWMSLSPAVPKLGAKPITDELVASSLKKAVGFLKPVLVDPKGFTGPAVDEGVYTLTAYSLMHAGEAIDDSELSISNPFMRGLLDQVKQYPMTDGFSTYCRALRLSALAMHNRDVDSAQIGKDRKWLFDSEVGGAYTYGMPAKGSTTINWDNSNCQYGVLGIWATVQAGILAPDKYWNEVEQHWLQYQSKDGGWGYQGDDSTLSMTSAGVTTLCVTAEQLELISSKGKRDAHPQITQAINKGLDWLAIDTNFAKFNGRFRGYCLYGLERAGLATGFRWFGNHDWYRELGAEEIKAQQEDGSWSRDPMETAFRVLFLSRGKQPILMNKLRFDGAWNNRPRDVAKLTQFASAQLEKPFAWGVADLNRNWWDWMETPYLFITTDTPPDFSDEDCKKLRAYTDAGGLIFLHNEYASKEVDEFAKSLCRRVYPDFPLQPVAQDDLVYSTVFPMKVKPVLQSVSNGTRTMLVYSPKDITQDWVRYKAKETRESPSRQLGLNLFVATAGKSDFRNRLNSPYEEVPDFAPVGTAPLLRISYAGRWNPEPKAYERFPRWFQKQTSIKLDIQSVELKSLSANQAPVATLTGNTAVDFSKMDLNALRDYVNAGGVLVIDATGGSKAFADSVKNSLMPTAFPGVITTGIPSEDPILSGSGVATDALPKPKLRNFVSSQLNGVAPSVQYASVGKGMIIFSELDLTTGLLNSGTYGIYGYTPAYSQSFMKNVILWALARYHAK